MAMPNYTTQVTLDVVVTYTVIPASDGFPEQLDITKVNAIADPGKKAANLLRFMDESQVINLEDEILIERNHHGT
jgi:hypothetical protein